MRTHWLIMILLALPSLSCTRKMIQVPINAPVTPAVKKDHASASPAATAPTPEDDSADLANQLRDPDLLNRLDDPSQQGTQKATPKPNKPVVIKGSDLPEPPKSGQPTPAPPLPPISGATGGKTPGSGN